MHVDLRGLWFNLENNNNNNNNKNNNNKKECWQCVTLKITFTT